jgi:hypothetical protein
MPLQIRREAFDRDKSGVLSPEVSFINKTKKLFKIILLKNSRILQLPTM